MLTEQVHGGAKKLSGATGRVGISTSQQHTMF